MPPSETPKELPLFNLGSDKTLPHPDSREVLHSVNITAIDHQGEVDDIPLIYEVFLGIFSFA